MNPLPTLEAYHIHRPLLSCQIQQRTFGSASFGSAAGKPFNCAINVGRHSLVCTSYFDFYMFSPNFLISASFYTPALSMWTPFNPITPSILATSTPRCPHSLDSNQYRYTVCITWGDSNIAVLVPMNGSRIRTSIAGYALLSRVYNHPTLAYNPFVYFH